jgi:hypothetical protein
VQLQQDRRAINMIAVQTPTDFFFIKIMAFKTAISPRSKKSENAVGTWRIAVSMTGALAIGKGNSKLFE